MSGLRHECRRLRHELRICASGARVWLVGSAPAAAGGGSCDVGDVGCVGWSTRARSRPSRGPRYDMDFSPFNESFFFAARAMFFRAYCLSFLLLQQSHFSRLSADIFESKPPKQTSSVRRTVQHKAYANCPRHLQSTSILTTKLQTNLENDLLVFLRK